MKSILFRHLSVFLLALLSTVLLGIPSCNKKGETPEPSQEQIDSVKQVLEDQDEEEEPDNLPPYYFKANMNGILWEADTCYFIYSSNAIPDTMELIFCAEVDTMSIHIRVHIPLGNLSGGCVPNSEFVNFNGPSRWINNLDFSHTNQVRSYGRTKAGGSTVITDCDFSSKTISGTFNYTKYSYVPGDSVHFTNGEYRIPLWEGMSWWE